MSYYLLTGCIMALHGRKRLKRQIDCPRCFAELEGEEIEVIGPNVIIDRCRACGGIWLDKGELNRLLRNRQLSDYLTKEIGTQSKSELVCPSCGGLMDIEVADEIEIDVCLSCGGVWLDAGELDKLKNLPADFKGDELAKAEERWEEMTRKERRSALTGLLRKLR